MSQVALGPINNTQPSVNLTPKPQLEAPKAREINQEMKAEGTKKVGEQAFDEAIKQLENLLKANNVSITSTVDEKGLQQVRLTDKTTGKNIAQMPPDGVVEMANRAREHHIGWLIDKMR